MKTNTYSDSKFKLINGDCFDELKKIKSKTINMVFADPPYFLSTENGISCQSGKMVSVKKGQWDKALSIEEKHEFNKNWIKECYRILKDDGCIWISGTFHNIYSIGMALEEEGFKIVNNVTWQKLNPPPNIACKCFVHSTETIIWAVKDKKHYTFNYELMKELNGGKQHKDVWPGSLTKKSEKKYGKHPTQKPEYILEKIILASTNKGDKVLDPFSGSGTTGAVAIRLKRKYIGIEKNKTFYNNSLKRLKGEESK